MRVLIVSHAYVEKANHKKLEILSRKLDLVVGVVYPKKWRTWHGEEKVKSEKLKVKSGYEEYVLDTFWPGDGGKYIYNPIQLIISILKFKPDLIHLEEEPFSFVAHQLAAVSFVLGIRLTFFTWENLFGLPLGILRSWSERTVFWKVEAAVVGTRGARERLERRGFKKRVEVIPQFGVDVDVFKRSLLEKKTSSEVIIGFVGRPTLDKGVDVLLEAVAKLPEKYQFLWVTSSASIPSVIGEQIRSLGLESRVMIETNVPHEKLGDCYRRMDVYVLPSRTKKTWQEQFGRTALEAMACGVPVVGSSSGAIPEILDKVGLIFNEGDSEDLKNKIEVLVEGSTRDRMIQTGLDWVRSNYSAEVVGRRTYDFYKSLV